LGRIKGTHIKRAARELLAKHAGSFSADFRENKKVLTRLKILDSSERNKLAGEIASLRRRQDKELQ